MTATQQEPSDGLFSADQIKDGDRYELSDGHRLHCMPGGEDHAEYNRSGCALLGSDPDAEWVGVDGGFSPKSNILRAPDVAVAARPAKRGGWMSGAPFLAVEYAARGQSEADLKLKIKQLLAAGTRYIWVVRLIGPHRVEVHTAKGMQLLSITDTLEAPGVLRNPVPVRALFDLTEAHRVTLDNLLQRKGYANLEAALLAGVDEAKAEGKEEGLKEGIEKGKEEGLKEGKEEGLKEGKEEGLKEGKEEGEKKKALEMAKIMKAEGESIDKIAKYSQLSIQEIEKL
ncbi:MAG: Uma2 family endonuclease [Gammaproteobacteria bacterium]|nr:Uma2 family endonuclease [Gammaproteobacteria bacterium]